MMAEEKTGEQPQTKMLDELEKGPWPSFVREIKNAAQTSPVCTDLLGQLEVSYQEKRNHWKHGGMVGVLGYGGGVIGRYSDMPDRFPHVAFPYAPHQPSFGMVLHERRTAKALRHLGAAWFRSYQHARFDGRHHFSRYQNRRTGAHI